MYVCMYVCMYLCIYLFVYAHLSVLRHIYICIYIYIYAHEDCVSLCVHIYRQRERERIWTLPEYDWEHIQTGTLS